MDSAPGADAARWVAEEKENGSWLLMLLLHHLAGDDAHHGADGAGDHRLSAGAGPSFAGTGAVPEPGGAGEAGSQ